MSKKSDSFAYGLLAIIAILYVIFETIYHFIIDHYVQIINLSLLVLFTILCLRFLSKKYKWFSFLKILFLKKKELQAYKELEELRDALERKDIKEVADALTDILYVTYGAGHAFGINLDKCFEEVQNSNMSKLDEDGKPIYNEKGKVMKGPNYFKPNLKKFVA